MESQRRNFKFGPFTLDTKERVLSRNGLGVRLQGQPYQILEILLGRAGKLVTRDELRVKLWPGDTFVDFEHGLNTSVKKLRQVLGDSSERASYIETVRGYGYRFVAPVETVLIEPRVPEEGAQISKQVREPVEERTPRLDSAADSSATPAPSRGSIPSRVWATPGSIWMATLLAVVLLSAGAYYLYRAHQQSQRLTGDDTVVLADFANSTGDQIYDDTLKTALRVSLRQSPFLNLLPDSAVARTLQLMTRPAGTKLTPEIARELCIRAGSKTYIAGAIGSLGSEYVMQLKAVNCQTGDMLAEQQVTATSREKVLDALGEAASSLRSKLGESLTTVQKFDVPLEQATTPSLEALKALSLGTIASGEQGVAAALPWHQRAIELDPNFAMGYRVVGGDYYELGEVGRAGEYLTKAFQLRQHASEREELEIASAYYRNVTGELDKAAQTLEEEIESYPREWRAYSTLGSLFVEQGQYEKATEITRQAMRMAPENGVMYGNLANSTIALQRFDETRQIVEEAQTRRTMDDYPLREILYALAFLKADSAEMARQEQWFTGKPKYENFGLALESDTEAYYGHLGKARELTRQAVDSAVRADSKESGAVWEAIGAQREAAFGNPVEARKTATAALKLAPTSQGVESEAALAFAMSGDTAEAQSLTRDLSKRFPLDTQMQSLWLPTIQAEAALTNKNSAPALTALQSASPVEFGEVLYVLNISCLYPAYVRGGAYLAAGQGTAAAREFQKILDHSGIVWNCWTGAMAHLGVARANALQFRTAQGPDADAARVRALAAYKEFLALWKSADPGVPILKQARAEYAKLQ